MQRDVVRISVGIVCVAGLLAVFIFQRFDAAGFSTGITNFIINRSIRFILNDLLTIGLIFALFGKRKYVIFSFWVQLAGVLFILMPYFLLKLKFPDYNGPLLSFLHRLIMNPLLLLLLIPA